MSPPARVRILAAALVLLSALQVRAETPRTDADGEPLPAGALARLGTVRLRHAGQIYLLAFSSDGKALAVAGIDNLGHRGLGWSVGEQGILRVWDPATGKELRPLEGQKGAPHSLAFVNKLLVTTNDRGPVRFWDPNTGKAVAPPEGLATGVSAIALSSDGKTLAAASAGKLRLIDPASGKEIRQFEVTEAIALIPYFSPDGKTLAATFSGPRGNPGVCLWDVASGEELHRMSAEAFRLGVAFSPDGKSLAIGSRSQPVSVWDVASGKETLSLGEASTSAGFVAFLAGGKELLSVGGGGAVVWDATTGKELRRIGEKSPRFLASAVDPDGKTLAGIQGNAVRLFDTATGKERLPSTAPISDVEAVAFSPDGKTALTGDSELRLWDAATGKQLVSLGSASRIGAAAFAPDGKAILAGYSQEQALRLWDSSSGKELRRFEGYIGEVETVGFLSDGHSVMSMCRQGTTRTPISITQKREMSLRVWDLATGKETRRVGEEMMEHATSSPDGRRLAGGMHQLGIWDALTGRELARMEPPSRGDRVLALAFTPDGRRLATSYFLGGPIRVYEVATGAVAGTLPGSERVTLSLAVAPNGRVVAGGGLDGTVRLWDLDTGKELRKLTGHQGPVLAVAFSPDGHRLISGSRDTTALIWDVSGILPAPAAVRLKAEELKELWLTLAGPDGDEALRVVRRLASDPERVLPFLREQLGKPPAVDPARLARLLADLDADDFDKREAASAELAGLGKLAEPALRRALEDKPSAEVRVRAESLLKKLDSRQQSAVVVQTLRALEILELIGTSQARAILESTAKGSVSPRVVEEAKASLDRLERRARQP